ncbi:MAG TPA: UPF0175 family protein [Blastocatellia bacterium]|nr:UPF0175 family protein [Blastocatellia bacterium]HMV81623.1 UPF0175 family protein [Blastocatellia bacterium]HMX28059.1 UPF0175 family protein [Blastocatellia bacterium]HMY71274.1 UPF0175 family protein [Blastocatellia bacterium]HMZ17987.1 UPF0175 family protein [Blastocatellia bacterium]
MEVAVKLAISDEVLNDPAVTLSRMLLEEFALEGYKSGQVTAAQLRRMLDFDTPMEVDGFLKSHGVFFDYSAEELAGEEQASQCLRLSKGL